ncbi:hypothetical protein UFOVP469_46 [uncultured Caudovirales phage]|uniref:Holliday junction nuclease RuvC n=1 Tax=uncultured Caudovirales phage TaxID=2100421 RepID=A0A6J5MH45_9CAUD|nr:hypothetical protein UFOVP469_46 [uncultured Caudovirales phage]CAB4189832.1 hypothetical protein UFOVP1200_19 [uncultured Caudovirales phage]
MSDAPILALDLARNTGWACGRPGETPHMGISALAPGEKSYGAIGGALEDWLWGMIDITKPSLIVFEAPLPAHNGIAAGRIALGLSMIVEMCGFRRDIVTRECAVTTVRKRVVGSGRAKKEDVMKWCIEQGWRPPGHDAADAAALWKLACDVRVSGNVMQL